MRDRPDTPRAALLALLGLPGDAARPEIVRAYRRWARHAHPDVSVGRDPAEASAEFAAVTDAYHEALRESAPEPPRPDAATPDAEHTSATVRPAQRPPTHRNPTDQPPIVAGPVTVVPPRPTQRGWLV